MCILTLQIYILTLFPSAASAAEVTIQPAGSCGSHGVQPVEAESIFGFESSASTPIEGIAPLQLPSLISVRVTGACSGLNETNLNGKTLLVFGTAACNALNEGLLLLLARLQPTGEIRAIVAREETTLGDAVEPNFGLLPPQQSLGTLLGRSVHIFSVRSSWASQLAGLLTTYVGCNLEVLVRTEPMPPLGASHDRQNVSAGHMVYYSYVHTRAEKVTITVTPSYGNPDLYVNVASTVGSAMLPTPRTTVFAKQTSPGDDALTLELGSSTMALVIGVYGHSASSFSISISSESTVVQLQRGQPQRFEVAAGGRRYFSLLAPQAGIQNNGVTIALTTLTTMLPDLLVGTEPRPTRESAHVSRWRSTSECKHAYAHTSTCAHAHMHAHPSLVAVVCPGQ